MNVVYLATLLAVSGCMMLIDRRYGLFFWQDARRATRVLALGLGFFLAWDLLGIRLGIFFRGDSAIMSGVLLAPELPLEEPVFLLFLCYLTMVLVTGIQRLTTQEQERRS